MSTRSDPYAYANTFYQGMKNITYLSGVLRRPGKEVFYIQPDNKADLLIPVHLTKGRSIPGKFVEGLPIKAICRIRGVMNKDTGEREVELHAMTVMRPQLNEIPASTRWLKKVDKSILESPEYKPFDRDTKPTREANKVQVAGFVSARYVEPPSALDQGRRTFVILLQQKENPEEAIPIRMTPKDPQYAKELVKPGMPLLFEGEVKLRPVPAGEPGADGLQKVRLVPYIYGGERPIPGDQQVIQVYPEWAEALQHLNKAITPKAKFTEAAANDSGEPLAGKPESSQKPGDDDDMNDLLDQAGA